MRLFVVWVYILCICSCLWSLKVVIFFFIVRIVSGFDLLEMCDRNRIFIFCRGREWLKY